MHPPSSLFLSQKQNIKRRSEIVCVCSNIATVRGGLQLSDISENPNNDRIGGDPPTHPPNPNKCLMLVVSVVLHIPGVHRYSIRFIKEEEK